MFSWELDRTFQYIGHEGERKKEIKDHCWESSLGTCMCGDPTNDGVQLRKELVESQT